MFSFCFLLKLQNLVSQFRFIWKRNMKTTKSRIGLITSMHIGQRAIQHKTTFVAISDGTLQHRDQLPHNLYPCFKVNINRRVRQVPLGLVLHFIKYKNVQEL